MTAREISRQEFMRRKLDKRSALVQKKDIACQKCDLMARQSDDSVMSMLTVVRAFGKTESTEIIQHFLR